MKQETLKEAAKRLFPNEMEEYDIFLIGARWQMERSYSEEDMNQYSDYVLMCSAEKTLKIPLPPKEWVEQFKKK